LDSSAQVTTPQVKLAQRRVKLFPDVLKLTKRLREIVTARELINKALNLIDARIKNQDLSKKLFALRINVLAACLGGVHVDNYTPT
jgi:hypothetical protein